MAGIAVSAAEPSVLWAAVRRAILAAVVIVATSLTPMPAVGQGFTLIDARLQQRANAMLVVDPEPGDRQS
jgi:hypothetical protein